MKELTDKQLKLIHKVYFDDKILFGRDKLYKYLQTNYKDAKISRRQVMKWLKDRELSQLYAPKKETKDIKRTVLTEPFMQVGIDLMDIATKEFDGYKWILSGIDLFSKKGYAAPLKNKKDKTVLIGFRKLLKQMKEKPHSIRSDFGSEFISDIFKEELKQRDIKQVLSKPNTPQSNGQVENFNKILKRLINMYITQTDDSNWIKVLPKLLKAYNSTISRITKKTPNQIENEDKEEQKKTKTNIEKSITPKNELHYEFKPFDKVRIKLENIEQSKGGFNI